MGFWEILPPQCPPIEAVDVAIVQAYRVVYSNPPAKEHFASFAKLGRPKPPHVNDCTYASCSLCTCIDKMRTLAGLPKVRAKNPFIAALSIPQGAGRSMIKDKHISFWMYDTFDPVAATLHVEAT